MSNQQSFCLSQEDGGNCGDDDGSLIGQKNYEGGYSRVKKVGRGVGNTKARKRVYHKLSLNQIEKAAIGHPSVMNGSGVRCRQKRQNFFDEDLFQFGEINGEMRESWGQSGERNQINIRCGSKKASMAIDKGGFGSAKTKGSKHKYKDIDYGHEKSSFHKPSSYNSPNGIFKDSQKDALILNCSKTNKLNNLNGLSTKNYGLLSINKARLFGFNRPNHYHHTQDLCRIEVSKNEFQKNAEEYFQNLKKSELNKSSELKQSLQECQYVVGKNTQVQQRQLMKSRPYSSHYGMQAYENCYPYVEGEKSCLQIGKRGQRQRVKKNNKGNLFSKMIQTEDFEEYNPDGLFALHRIRLFLFKKPRVNINIVTLPIYKLIGSENQSLLLPQKDSQIEKKIIIEPLYDYFMERLKHNSKNKNENEKKNDSFCLEVFITLGYSLKTKRIKLDLKTATAAVDYGNEGFLFEMKGEKVDLVDMVKEWLMCCQKQELKEEEFAHVLIFDEASSNDGCIEGHLRDRINQARDSDHQSGFGSFLFEFFVHKSRVSRFQSSEVEISYLKYFVRRILAFDCLEGDCCQNVSTSHSTVMNKKAPCTSSSCLSSIAQIQRSVDLLFEGDLKMPDEILQAIDQDLDRNVLVMFGEGEWIEINLRVMLSSANKRLNLIKKEIYEGYNWNGLSLKPDQKERSMLISKKKDGNKESKKKGLSYHHHQHFRLEHFYI